MVIKPNLFETCLFIGLHATEIFSGKIMKIVYVGEKESMKEGQKKKEYV